ncbi:MAG: NAD-dependent epimerase/dehydratase family protein [Ignavibacteriales bacterium]|nr:NAD-dependent epimerase/dehydratase family protein [Ignavibacteriales bacterium]
MSLVWLRSLPVEIREAHFYNASSLARLTTDVDYVVHIAGTTKAKRPAEYVRGNVEATRNLLQACTTSAGIKKFTFISSLTALGPSADGSLLDESAECHPLTSYGKSKLQAEHLCESFNTQLPIVIIRPTAVYGPRDRDILEMFRWVGYGIKPIIGSREKSLSLIHAEDLARGIADATLSSATAGNIYHLSERQPHSFSWLIDTLAQIVHRQPLSIRLPNSLLFAVAGIVEAISFLGPKPAVFSLDKARDIIQPHWICSAEKALTEFGFETRIHTETGLRQTYEWYKKEGWL